MTGLGVAGPAPWASRYALLRGGEDGMLSSASSGEGGAGSANVATGPGFSVLGDSISTLAGWVPEGWRVHYGGEASVPGVQAPEDTWWGRVIAHFGGHLVANSSYSGSVVEGFGFPAGCSPERAAALVGAGGELPDVVLVFMGINDYGWGGGRNQVMGGSASASARPDDLEGPHEVSMVVGQDALERFETAYARMLEGARAVAPDASAWCLTLAPGTAPEVPGECYKYRIRGVDLDEYNGAIRRAAARAGAHVADVRAFGVDFDAVDGAHPSARGMRQIADMVVAQMEGLPADASGLPSLEGAPTSRRRCSRDCCAGCPAADPTPERWTIVCTRPEAVSGASVGTNADI